VAQGAADSVFLWLLRDLVHWQIIEYDNPLLQQIYFFFSFLFFSFLFWES
jgi:hypothetical protein